MKQRGNICKRPRSNHLSSAREERDGPAGRDRYQRWRKFGFRNAIHRYFVPISSILYQDVPKKSARASRTAEEELNRPMRDVAILADDLTGALDAAAAFGSASAPVDVGWDIRLGLRIAIDSETRAVLPEAARSRVSRLLPALAGSGIAFKKIDSLLRGNSYAEIATCCASGAFDAVYIAPAFPEQGRTTEGGCLRVGGGPADQLLSISDLLCVEGIAAVSVAVGDHPPSRGVFVCDARTDEDLARLVRIVGLSRERVLWCGSAGLAYALATTTPTVVAAPANLAIIGSRHRTSQASAAWLRRNLGPYAVDLNDPRRLDSAIDALAGALRSRHRAALIFDLPDMPAEAAEACYREAFATLSEAIPRPSGAVVVGGDTLFRLVGATGAASLKAIGHRSPGLPVSRIEGGAWHGTLVTSKSGAFDDGGLFADFVQGELKSA